MSIAFFAIIAANIKKGKTEKSLSIRLFLLFLFLMLEIIWCLEYSIWQNSSSMLDDGLSLGFIASGILLTIVEYLYSDS